MSERITVKAKPDGTVEVSVDGIKGASCTDVTKAVEKALGAVSSDRKTPEFHQQAAIGQRVQQGGK